MIIARFCFLIGRNFRVDISTARTETHTVGWRGGSDRTAGRLSRTGAWPSLHAPTVVEIVYQDQFILPRQPYSNSPTFSITYRDISLDETAAYVTRLNYILYADSIVWYEYPSTEFHIIFNLYT